MPKLLRDERPALQAALDAFREGLTERITGSGQRQSGTKTEDQAFENLKKLVQATDKKLLLAASLHRCKYVTGPPG